ncbi:MAG: glycosyltransferase family 1 protein [Lachnospiraceae bacterium]
MRVLQIGLSYNPGGVENFVMNYYRQMVKQGIQFDFICMYSTLAYEEEIKSMGGHIYYVEDIKKNPWGYRRQLLDILRKQDYAAVHVNMLSAANIVPLQVARKAGVKKIIAHSHNSSSPGILRNVLHELHKRRISKIATDFCACSQVAGQWLYTEGVEFQIIHNAIDMSKYLYDEQIRTEMRRELGVEGKYVIGHVGRFEEQKNHAFLIDTFQELAKQQENAILLLIGEGDLQKAMMKKVAKEGLANRVRFLGIRHDVPKLWQAMDAFLLPSLFEGLPLVAVEAQAAGLPCFVASTITREVAITEDVVFISLEASAKNWAKKIVEYADYVRKDKELILQQCREKGYEIESASQELKKLYTRV